jgi:TRAP-type transport system small permease protein
MAKIFRILEKINSFVVPIGLMAMLSMVLAVTINVIGRAFFGAPLYGSVEIVEFTAVLLVTCVAGYTQIKKENIIIGIVIDRFSPRLRASFDFVTSILSLLIIGVLIWTGVIYTLETLSYGEITHVFRISTVPFRAAWAVGLFLMALVILAQVADNLIKAVKK